MSLTIQGGKNFQEGANFPPGLPKINPAIKVFR